MTPREFKKAANKKKKSKRSQPQKPTVHEGDDYTEYERIKFDHDLRKWGER